MPCGHLLLGQSPQLWTQEKVGGMYNTVTDSVFPLPTNFVVNVDILLSFRGKPILCSKLCYNFRSLFPIHSGLIPIPPGHTVVQQQGPPPQHGMYPVHSAPLMQPGIIQHQTLAGDMGGMIPHGGGRGEFHHHGFVGHPPPPGATGFRPRPPGPGGNYY